MNQGSETLTEQQEVLKLKLPEPEVSSEKPWQDDVLNRKDIASRLTKLIQNQSLPFVISIHGEWGTGKTFMLKRWQRDLENQGFKAIYFNAWEDDFCDDPLLAVIGQLSDYFEKGQGGKFKGFLQKIRKNAGPLLRANANSLLTKHLGVTGDTGIARQDSRDLIDEYLDQARTKDTLKKALGGMAEAVFQENGHPLIFIIDELDRCRPTFAIELLEKVKHIFDVPNMVFVLGINRAELCKSLQSIYGEIKADVYLRRFFDMEFILPEVGAEQFSRHLIRKFELTEFFASLSKSANRKIHSEDFSMLEKYFPELWSRLGLRLRDIDYCVRLIALAGRSMTPGNAMYPWLLGLLVTLQFKNPTLYTRYIQGDCRGSAIMDYLDALLPPRDEDYEFQRTIDLIEAFIYHADQWSPHSIRSKSDPLDQLGLLQQCSDLTHPKYLSERTQKSGSERASNLLELLKRDRFRPLRDIKSYLGGLINLHQGLTRR